MLQRQRHSSLCSATKDDLVVVVPRCRLRFDERAFTVAAPRLWNGLPREVPHTSLAAFIKKLKLSCSRFKTSTEVA